MKKGPLCKAGRYNQKLGSAIMAHNTKPTAQQRSFAARVRHFAATQQGIINHIAEGDAARKLVRSLLTAAVRARAEQ